MGQIHILDEVLSNQIAAGEVVERPASAAKELIDNALDAHATAVTCEIVDGGVTLLRVVDDGQGMTPEDARLAIKRHATSKISVVDDLNTISTLGFRGEALPSIASVSRLSIRTKRPGDVGALLLRVEGGIVVEERQVAGPVGTEIRVEDLFYNVPARRKFLKKANTESSHVLETVQRAALCYPDRAFRCVRDGRTVLDVPKGQTLTARAQGVFGRRQTEDLKPVTYEPGEGWQLDGLIGAPRSARSTARHYHVFINGRYVRDRVVMAAVKSAYSNRLERGRHPFVILRLQMPPEAVDVNVHPAKTEVRFVDSNAVHRLVSRGIGGVLAQEPWAAPDEDLGRAYQLEAQVPTHDSPATIPSPPPDRAGLEAHRKRIFDVMEQLAARRGSGLSRPTGPSVPRPGPVGVPRPVAQPGLDRRPPGPAEPLELAVQAAEPAQAAADPTPQAATVLSHAQSLSELDPAGFSFVALLGTRWAALRGADGLLLVDVIAARTRVAYDRLRAGTPGRPLHAAVQVEVTPLEARQLEVRAGALTPFGLEVEPFGGTTWTIGRAPAGLPPEAAPALLRAALAMDGDADAIALCVAEHVAEHMGVPTASEVQGLPAAIAAATRLPPRPVRWAVALTDAELLRRATEDRIR